MTELIRYIAKFGVRNDKNRGLLLQTIETSDGDDIYFFKYRDQPIERHCEQMQNIVRSAGVRRSKMMLVDLSPFLHEYCSGGSIMFKGTKLNSVNQRVQKIQQMTINKEIGALKRKQTMANKNHAKIAAKEQQDEANFLAERGRKIKELVEERNRIRAELPQQTE